MARPKHASAHLKSLRVEANSLRKILKETDEDSRQASKARIRLAQIKRKIKSMPPTVSEHAIVAFVERAIGITRDDIERQIMTPAIKNMIMASGDGTYPISDDLSIVVQNNVVVTITPN